MTRIRSGATSCTHSHGKAGRPSKYQQSQLASRKRVGQAIGRCWMVRRTRVTLSLAGLTGPSALRGGHYGSASPQDPLMHERDASTAIPTILLAEGNRSLGRWLGVLLTES